MRLHIHWQWTWNATSSIIRLNVRVDNQKICCICVLYTISVDSTAESQTRSCVLSATFRNCCQKYHMQYSSRQWTTPLCWVKRTRRVHAQWHTCTYVATTAVLNNAHHLQCWCSPLLSQPAPLLRWYHFQRRLLHRHSHPPAPFSSSLAPLQRRSELALFLQVVLRRPSCWMT